MNFELHSMGLTEVQNEKCDALILLVSDDFKAGKDALSQLVAQALKARDFETKPGQQLCVYRPAKTQVTHCVVVGVGKGGYRDVRGAVQSACGAIKGKGVKKLALAFASPTTAESLRAAVNAVADATYVYTHTKSKPEGRSVAHTVVSAPNAAELQGDFDRACAIVVGAEEAKEWANRPGNHSTPSHLARAAQAMGKQPKFSCEVLGPKEVAKLGMGSFMAVAQGSTEPLRFIVLRYNGASKTQAPVVLVGKGITFDSGGISLKPGAEMDEMKFDMSGAASVLGVFRALAQLKPNLNVVGLIAACENMPAGNALKPGDVITSMSGQTIEILNTDAEGRLILCDALTYAERFKPQAVVDIATLTGACVIALGGVRSGMYASRDDLADALTSAGEVAQDLCWRMPLDDEYGEGLKTHFADVANVAGRPGGSITAAKFLQRFADKYPWAHLDIAGTAWKGGAAKGATGRPVGLLVEYLMAQAYTK